MKQKNERPPYKPAFNIQMYNAIDNVDLMIRETHPSREVIDLYEEAVNYYAGLTFVFDNLSQIIWVWIPIYGPKKRGWVKKLARLGHKCVESQDPSVCKKFSKEVIERLEEELNCTITNYEVKPVIEGQHPDDFEYLFLYEVQEYGLYSQHYFRPDVQMRMPMEEYDAPSEEPVRKCPNCGWIVSKDATHCPRCKAELPPPE